MLGIPLYLPFLLYHGFTSSVVKNSAFYHRDNTRAIYMLVYVDVIVIVLDMHSIYFLIHRMSTHFTIKNLGPPHFLLGISVNQNLTVLLFSEE